MRFSIDWEKIINDDEDPPAELVVTSAMDGEKHKEGLSNLSNTELTEKIRRLKRSLSGTIGARLRDGGEKLRANIQLHEGELERRQRVGSQKLLYSSYYFKKDSLKVGCDLIGAPDDFEPQASPSVSSPQSMFAACFLNKLEAKADSKTANAFKKELYALNPCNKRTSNRQFSQRKHKRELLSQEAPYKFPADKVESVLNVDLKGRDSSTPRYSEEKFASCFSKKTKASQAQSSHTKRHANGEAVVLVDEEEPDANKAVDRMDEVVECRNATKIYYPSRVDPESVEICCSDMESLAPEAYLSSTIMNFYIRYLQKKKAHADVVEYHFFNTYFYKKLKAAVLSKQNEKEASFFKLRRWWKGVNIFEKAYIFLPVHEDLHWSLVIICIPDKEDQLGPILLHLDSLGLHCSKSLFGTIRKFLEQEWKFLRQGEVPALPFSDKIWENLPRRIDENVIPVPQQRNEYDCGLFVLFFMERFMEEVHGRLKKKDFMMFGRRWFKPEEASRLRMKIHNILEEEFKNASED